MAVRRSTQTKQNGCCRDPKCADQKDALPAALPETALRLWREMLDHATLMDFHKGQVIFYQGHLPYGAFVLVTGAVTLKVEDEEGNGRPFPLAPGVPFGIDLVLLDKPYPGTAVACENTLVLFVPKSCLFCKHAAD